MSEHRTEKSRYKSPSTGDYCTSSQYIAEMMCQRMAENNNEGSLAYKFWNTDKWKSVYTQQIILANRLVKKHDERAVIRALQSSRGSKIYSLRFPALIHLIETEEGILEKSEKLLESSDEIELGDIHSKPPKPYGTQSKISKLRNLDE